jgi:hypothetical protein
MKKSEKMQSMKDTIHNLKIQVASLEDRVQAIEDAYMDKPVDMQGPAVINDPT